MQVVGDMQAVVPNEARQPLPSRPHFSSFPDEQRAPLLVHSAGGVGHDPQVAAPAAPVQGWVQGVVPLWTRQLAASIAQVTTALLLLGSQKVPVPLQADGLAGHWQTALGNVPPHGSFDAQGVVADA